MSTLLEDLRKYFLETPSEKVKSDWVNSEKYDEVGPPVDEFIEVSKKYYTMQCPDANNINQVIINLENKGNQEMVVDFNPSGVYIQEKSQYNLKFTFKAFFEEQGIENPYVLIECTGFFKFEDVQDTDQIPSFFYRNAIAILFPYLRAFVSMVTLQANVAPVVLPTLNLSDLEQPLKDNTTLKNKGNSAYVEREGPFNCNWENAWLGEGYYFWEAFINSAHWWGKNHCQNNYFICEAFCSITDANCFDLVGDTSHMQIFSDAIDQMKTEGLIDQKTTVTRILNYLTDIGIFKFEATRAVGYSSIGQKSSKYLKRMLFEIPKNSKPDHYLHYQPPIQVCFYGKNSMDLNGYKIIFPDEYNQCYVL